MALPPMDAATARVLRKSHSHEERLSANKPPHPLRSNSFRGRAANTPEQRQLRRPRTQPDVLVDATGWRAGGVMSSTKLPPKVLVNVTVKGCLGPVQVMALTDWSVKELVAATVQVYIKQGRRPLLPATEGKAFSLHYSQFYFECLEPQEKLVELGSRNFFLCPKPINAATAVVPVASPSNGFEIPTDWLRFIAFVI